MNHTITMTVDLLVLNHFYKSNLCPFESSNGSSGLKFKLFCLETPLIFSVSEHNVSELSTLWDGNNQNNLCIQS